MLPEVVVHYNKVAEVAEQLRQELHQILPALVAQAEQVLIKAVDLAQQLASAEYLVAVAVVVKLTAVAQCPQVAQVAAAMDP
jgi:hypothetical protein